MTDEDNINSQKDEFEALNLIYEDCVLALDTNPTTGVITAFKVLVSSIPPINLDIKYNDRYPSDLPPEFMITAVGGGLSSTFMEETNKEFTDIVEAASGGVVVYEWVEHLRSKLDNLGIDAGNETATSDAAKKFNGSMHSQTVKLGTSGLDTITPQSEDGTVSTGHSDLSSTSQVENTDPSQGLHQLPSKNEIFIHHGEPFTDRKSTFQAHLAVVQSEEDIRQVMSTLLADKKIARATHNISAYRFLQQPNHGTEDISNATTSPVQVQDCDDDGENAAGGRLLMLLQVMDANDVLVVVSRWYGGILLGPDRFKHINNVARVLVESVGLDGRSKKQGSGGGGKGKKR